ncbi:hypothetical protein T484DRAFT_1942899 [Baffinella frigidus]|nr:hypothetical protein T484DRAFT_1942899 [Cryptophyta sp. CCMP2293]
MGEEGGYQMVHGMLDVMHSVEEGAGFFNIFGHAHPHPHSSPPHTHTPSDVGGKAQPEPLPKKKDEVHVTLPPVYGDAETTAGRNEEELEALLDDKSRALAQMGAEVARLRDAVAAGVPKDHLQALQAAAKRSADLWQERALAANRRADLAEASALRWQAAASATSHSWQEDKEELESRLLEAESRALGLAEKNSEMVDVEELEASAQQVDDLLAQNQVLQEMVALGSTSNVELALQAQVEALSEELKRSVEMSDLTITHLKGQLAKATYSVDVQRDGVSTLSLNGAGVGAIGLVAGSKGQSRQRT